MDLTAKLLDSDDLPVFNTDDPADRRKLQRMSPTRDRLEVKLRRRDSLTQGYNSTAWLLKTGCPSYEQADWTFPLVPKADWEQAIRYAHEHQSMPAYHAYQWRPKGQKYNQNGLGYCWTWGGTGSVMSTRAKEDKELIFLAPVSMGYLVGWRNEGNFLGSFLKGARDDGICPAKTQNLQGMNNHTNRASEWPMQGERQRFRLGDSIELSPDNMQQHCVSAILNGHTIYVAYMWWGHAVELVGYRYQSGELQTLISNSHNEEDLIVLTGSRAVPYEAHAIISTLLTETDETFDGAIMEARADALYRSWDVTAEPHLLTTS